MTQFVGRDVAVEFAIADETASVGSLSWLTLGGMRQKSMDATWDDVDSTDDASPQFTKQYLTTFKSLEFTGDGTSRTDALYNQQTLKAHVVNPGSSTGNQPKVWLRMTGPDGVWLGPFTITKWTDGRSYADVATWSISGKSNGAVTFTPA